MAASALLGDAAHPMYPVGLERRCRAGGSLDARRVSPTGCESPTTRCKRLHEYERDRLPKTAEIVRLNRKASGPERVIDEVEKLAPRGF